MRWSTARLSTGWGSGRSLAGELLLGGWFVDFGLVGIYDAAMLAKGPGDRRWLLWLCLAAAHVALALVFLLDRSPGTRAAVTGFPLDDAWIHLVYGRELTQHALPCYNDAKPEAGFTSPLWIVVCGAAHAVSSLTGLSVVVVLKVITVLCALGASIAVARLVLAFDCGTFGALLAGLLCSVTPALAFSQVSGMEVCLASGLSLWAVYALLRERYLASGLLLAAAYLARPELAVLPVVVVVGVLGSWRGEVLKARRKDFLRLVLPGIVVVAAWCVYCLAVTGRPLPNTFYVKFDRGRPEGVVTVFRENVWSLPANFLWSGAVLYVVGCFYMIKRAPGGRWLVLLFPWLFFMAVASSRAMPPGTGDYFYWQRYIVPGLPFLLIPIGAGWHFLWGGSAVRKSGGGASTDDRAVQRGSRKTARRGPSANIEDQQRGAPPWLRTVSRVAAVALAVLAFAGHPRALDRKREQFAWNCQNMNEVQVHLGRWVAENTPEDAVVLVNDAGAIRYFGRRRTIDIIGLNYHPFALHPSDRAKATSSPGGMLAFMKSQDAEYLIVFPNQYRGVLAHPMSETFFSFEHVARSDHYTVAPAPQAVMAVYRLRQ